MPGRPRGLGRPGGQGFKPRGWEGRAAKQQQDLARVRAERDDLRGQAQLLARIVHVLEVENSKLKETNEALKQQVATHTSVPDLAQRRRRPCPTSGVA